MAERALSAAVVTVSSSRTPDDDPGGDELADYAVALGAEVVAREIATDDQEVLEERLRHLCDEVACDLVLTTGGTGFTPDDVTPEATLAVAERLVPRIAEALPHGLRLLRGESDRH